MIQVKWLAVTVVEILPAMADKVLYVIEDLVIQGREMSFLVGENN